MSRAVDPSRPVSSYVSTAQLPLIFLLCFFLVGPLSLPLGSATLTHQFYYEDQAHSLVNLSLVGGDPNRKVSLNYSSDQVLEAGFGLQVDPDRGVTEKLVIDLSNDTAENDDWVWGDTSVHGDQGFGALGRQTRFFDNTTHKAYSSYSFSLEGTGAISSAPLFTRIPVGKQLEVTQARLTIGGRQAGSESFYPALKATPLTSQGSTARFAQLAHDDSDRVHLVWQDDGDPSNSGKSPLYNDVLYNRWNGSAWSGVQQLSGSDTLSSTYNLFPAVAVAGEQVYVVWNEYREVNDTALHRIWMVISSDGGETFGKPFELTDNTSASILPLDSAPVVATSDDSVFVAWHANNSQDGSPQWQVFFRRSEDQGVTWDETLELSDRSGGQAALNPSLVLAGEKLYLVWQDRGDSDGDGEGDFDVLLRTSSDGGVSWSVPVLVGDTNRQAYYPKVTADDTGHVHLVWNSFGPRMDNSTIQYRHSSDGGDTWSDQTQLSQTEMDLTPTHPSIALDQGSVYVAWEQALATSSGPDPYQEQVVLTMSQDQGSNFQDPLNLSASGWAPHRGDRVALAVDDEGLLWAAWSDEQQALDGQGEHIGNDPDIWLRQALDRNLTRWDTPRFASQFPQFADQLTPQLAGDEAGQLYMVYWDGGDLKGSGNARNSWTQGSYVFARSSDGGSSWSDHRALTQREGQGQSSWSGYAMSPAIAVGQQGHVYTLWTELDRNGTTNPEFRLLMRPLEDQGRDWQEVVELVNSTNPLQEFKIAAQGEYVYVVYVEYAQGDYHLYLRVSDDMGATWGASQELFTGQAHAVSLSVSGEAMVVGWQFDAFPHYRVSTDNGQRWSQTRSLAAGSQANYPQFSLDDDYLYLTYRGREAGDNYDDIMFRSSQDLGMSWEPALRVSETLPDTAYYHYLPGMASDHGLIYIAYTHYNLSYQSYDLKAVVSFDHGQSWSTPRLLSQDARQEQTFRNARPGVYLSDQAVVAWSDRSPKHGQYQIWTTSTKTLSYPENPQLDVGDDGLIEWSYEGHLDREAGFIVISGDGLREAFNRYLAGTPELYQDPDYEIQLAQVPLVVSSDAAGRLLVFGLEIEYKVILSISNSRLLNRLNRLADKASEQGASSSPANLFILSDTNVSFTLRDLKLVTADSDLALSNLTVKGELKEGFELDLQLEVTNTGTGGAHASIDIWAARVGESQDHDPANHLHTLELWVDNDGRPVLSPPFLWKDIPAGQFNLYAAIRSARPADRSTGNDQLWQALTVTTTHPQVVLQSFSLVGPGTPIEGQTTELKVGLENRGDKRALVEVSLFEEQAQGSPIDNGSLQLTLPAHSTRPAYFLWQARNVSRLVAQLEELQEGRTLERSLPLKVKRLPVFISQGYRYYPEIITRANQAYLNLSWTNQGDFDVRADVSLSLIKGRVEKTLVHRSQEPFAAGQTQTFSQLVRFDDAGLDLSGDLLGSYTLHSKVYNLNPQEHEPQGAWDGARLSFYSNESFMVYEPPDVRLRGLDLHGAAPFCDGSRLSLRVDLVNTGGAGATGKLLLYVFPAAAGPGPHPKVKLNFTVEAGGERTLGMDWPVPQGYVGTFSLRVMAAGIIPSEAPGWERDNSFELIGLDIILCSSGTSNEAPPVITPFTGSLLLLLLACASVFSYRYHYHGENGQYRLWTLLAPLLFKRRARRMDDPLAHETRGMIRGYLIAHPGAHYNLIKKNLELNNGTAAHHLSILEREGFVTSKAKGQFRCFYPILNGRITTEPVELEENEIDQQIISVLSAVEGQEYIRPDSTLKKVLEIIKANPGISQVEIAQRMKLSNPTVKYNADNLIAKGLVIKKRRGMRVAYYLVDLPID